MICTALKHVPPCGFSYERCESREHFNTNRGPSNRFVAYAETLAEVKTSILKRSG